MKDADRMDSKGDQIREAVDGCTKQKSLMEAQVTQAEVGEVRSRRVCLRDRIRITEC